MTEKSYNSPQNQISLIAFKADKLHFEVKDISEEDNSTLHNFELNLESDTLTDNTFGIVYHVLVVFYSSDDNVKLEVELDYVAIFECSTKIDKEFLESSFVKISAPAIGFPYVRAFISNLSLQAGFPPIMLPSINFVQFSQQQESNVKKGFD